MKTKHSDIKPARSSGLGLPLFLLLLTAGLFVAGCAKEKKVSQKPIDCTGTYALVSIDGKNLPCTPPHEGGAPEVQSGSLTLNSDGTHSSTIRFRVPPDKTGTREVKGSYTRDGNALNMKWEGAGTTTARLTGNTLSMINEGVEFAYRK